MPRKELDFTNFLKLFEMSANKVPGEEILTFIDQLSKSQIREIKKIVLKLAQIGFVSFYNRPLPISILDPNLNKKIKEAKNPLDRHFIDIEIVKPKNPEIFKQAIKKYLKKGFYVHFITHPDEQSEFKNIKKQPPKNTGYKMGGYKTGRRKDGIKY